jgi:hypothetical protein
VDVLLFYAGLLSTLVGLVSLLKPLRVLRIPTRRRGGAVLLAGVLVTAIAALLEAPLRRSEGRLGIDRFMPEYHFNEVHSTRIRAPAQRILEAAKAVTPAEVRFARTLMGIRSLPKRLAGNAAGEERLSRPILEPRQDGRSAVLVDDQRELVHGLVGQFWRPASSATSRPIQVTTADEFLALERPDYAKATINFVVAEEGDGWCRVTTETRVFTPDPKTRRRFAAYWRLIYPGSSLLRRTWLAAIKRRAEAFGP